MKNMKDYKYENKKKITLALAWIGLILIVFIIGIMAYAMITQNGKLVLAMIIALAFTSIIYWIGIRVYKAKLARDEKMHDEETKGDITNIAKQNTKNM